MSEKPNVTVIYQDAKSAAPGCAAIAWEVAFFVILFGGFALLWGWR